MGLVYLERPYPHAGGPPLYSSLPHAGPRMLLQGPTFEGFPAEIAVLLVVFIFIAILVAIVIVVLVAVWMYRDAKQRGESPGVWVTLFIVASIFGLVPFGILVVIIYLLTRPKEIKFDRYGNPVGPGVPPAAWQTPQPGWSSPPTPPSPTGWQTAPRAPGGWPSPPPPAPPGAPMWGGARPSKVKCPRCHTIFEYQKMPSGPTHVKCPSCGEEGTI